MIKKSTFLLTILRMWTVSSQILVKNVLLVISCQILSNVENLGSLICQIWCELGPTSFTHHTVNVYVHFFFKKGVMTICLFIIGKFQTPSGAWCGLYQC